MTKMVVVLSGTAERNSNNANAKNKKLIRFIMSGLILKEGSGLSHDKPLPEVNFITKTNIKIIIPERIHNHW